MSMYEWICKTTTSEWQELGKVKVYMYKKSARTRMVLKVPHCKKHGAAGTHRTVIISRHAMVNAR